MNDTNESLEKPPTPSVPTDEPAANRNETGTGAETTRTNPRANGKKRLAPVLLGILGAAVIGGLTFAFLGNGETDVLSKATITMGDGNVVEYTFNYDENGYLSKAHFHDDKSSEATITYECDPTGKILHASLDNSEGTEEATYEYDGDLYRGVEIEDENGDLFTKEIDIEHGKQTAIREYDSTSSTYYEYTYDSNGFVETASKSSDTGEYSFETRQHDSEGRITEMTYDDNAGGWERRFVQHKSFTNDGQLKRIAFKTTNDSSGYESSTTYKYNDGKCAEANTTGSLLKIDNNGKLEKTNPETEKSKYEYDEKGRLIKIISLTSDGKESIVTYEYDGEGRLLKTVEPGSDGDTQVTKYEYTKAKKSPLSNLYLPRSTSDQLTKRDDRAASNPAIDLDEMMTPLDVGYMRLPM